MARILFYYGIAVYFLSAILSCASVEPGKVNVELPKTRPHIKISSYTKALRQLGLMTEIFDTPVVRVMMNPIGDETGASAATGAEIPRDITEMVKSALNSIGGRVIYVPYDPAFIQNNIVTDYSQFENKVIPDVVITGGITEFDRGLETRGKNTDIGAEARVALPGDLPKGYVGFDYGSGSKMGLARITLDFNMLNFQNMVGIPLMNTSNTMEVTKAISQKELGITLFGASFGRKGSIKKVQGRHNAVRLIVELSVIQMIGKYLKLPYWVLLDEDVQPDGIVISELKKEFFTLSEEERIKKVQEYLFLMGHDISIDGILGEETKKAITKLAPDFSPNATCIDFNTYLKIIESVPIKEEILARRQILAQRLQAGQSSTATSPNTISTPGYESNTGKTPSETEHHDVENRDLKHERRPGIGRLLKEEEW